MILNENLFEDTKENLNESYSARWDNIVSYSNPIKQQYADLVNDQIFDALDNIDVLASSKISDLPEQTDFGFDQAERVSKAIANLVRTMTKEYFLFTDLKDESLEESLDSQIDDLLKKYAGEDRKNEKIYKWIGTGTLSLDLNPDDESVSRVSDRLEQDGFELVDRYDGSTDEDSYIVYTKTSGEDKYLADILFYDGSATLQLEINPEDEDSLEYFNEALKESIEYIKWVQLPDGKWKIWGSNNGSELDPNFLDRARKQNGVEYKDAKVSKNGEYPEGVSEEDIYEKHKFTTESLNEDKIADKIRANQNTKDMTKRAIKMLKNLGGDYEDLAKEFKDAYGEDPLEEVDESLKESDPYARKDYEDTYLVNWRDSDGRSRDTLVRGVKYAQHAIDKVKDKYGSINVEILGCEEVSLFTSPKRLKNADELKESYEDLSYVKKAFAYDIYKDTDNMFVLLDGDGDEVYRSDNTLDCLKWAKKNSSKGWNFNNRFDWNRLKENKNADELKESYEVHVDMGFRKNIETYDTKEEAEARVDELNQLKKKPSMRGLKVYIYE